MIGNTPLEQQARKMSRLDHRKIWLRAANVESVKRLVKVLNQNQLRKSKDSLNKPLYSVYNESGVYSITTQLLSRGKKKAGTPYTLEDTGHFYDSIVVSVTIDSIRIDADPIKTDTNLFEEYGKEIIGLTDENLQTVTQIILLNFQKETRIAIGL